MKKAKLLVVLWKVLLTGISLERTRTTRTPAFWGYPRRLTITHTNESNFWILKQTWHETHLSNLLYTMCKYEMDPTSIVEDIERTRFCPQTDRRQGENILPPFNFVAAGGIIMISTSRNLHVLPWNISITFLYHQLFSLMSWTLQMLFHFIKLVVTWCSPIIGMFLYYLLFSQAIGMTSL